MSYPTKPTFIQEGDWSSVSDSHPAMKWMADYTRAFDSGNRDGMYEKYLTSDFVYSKSTGEIFPPGQASWDALLQTYALLTECHHEPYFLACWESDDGSGWEMTGNAWLFANLPGGGAKSFADLTGRQWEVRVPAGFHFIYRKEGGGIKMATTAITSDSGPIVVELLKRGMLKPADLGL